MSHFSTAGGEYKPKALTVKTIMILSPFRAVGCLLVFCSVAKAQSKDQRSLNAITFHNSQGPICSETNEAVSITLESGWDGFLTLDVDWGDDKENQYGMNVKSSKHYTIDHIFEKEGEFEVMADAQVKALNREGNQWDTINESISLQVIVRDDGCNMAMVAMMSARSSIGPKDLTKVGEKLGLHMLSRCEGDCNKDEDCKDGLKCMKRKDVGGPLVSVPGCFGAPERKVDYCYDPKDAYKTLELKPIPRFSSEPKDLTKVGEKLGLGMLEKCEGDCNKDADCMDGLSCMKREMFGGPLVSVPGCNGTPEKKVDYCYNPLDAETSKTLGAVLEPDLRSSSEPADVRLCDTQEEKKCRKSCYEEKECDDNDEDCKKKCREMCCEYEETPEQTTSLQALPRSPIEPTDPTSIRKCDLPNEVECKKSCFEVEECGDNDEDCKKKCREMCCEYEETPEQTTSLEALPRSSIEPTDPIRKCDSEQETICRNSCFEQDNCGEDDEECKKVCRGRCCEYEETPSLEANLRSSSEPTDNRLCNTDEEKYCREACFEEKSCDKNDDEECRKLCRRECCDDESSEEKLGAVLRSSSEPTDNRLCNTDKEKYLCNTKGERKCRELCFEIEKCDENDDEDCRKMCRKQCCSDNDVFPMPSNPELDSVTSVPTPAPVTSAPTSAPTSSPTPGPTPIPTSSPTKTPVVPVTPAPIVPPTPAPVAAPRAKPAASNPNGPVRSFSFEVDPAEDFPSSTDEVAYVAKFCFTPDTTEVSYHTVDWGVGTGGIGLEADVIAGQAFCMSRTYDEVGTYSVIVKDASGSTVVAKEVCICSDECIIGELGSSLTCPEIEKQTHNNLRVESGAAKTLLIATWSAVLALSVSMAMLS